MTPSHHLEVFLETARQLPRVATAPEAIRASIAQLVRYTGDRTTNRLVMACLLAKIDRLEFDPRKPCARPGSPDSFDAQWYDEHFLRPFFERHSLPHQGRCEFALPVYVSVEDAPPSEAPLSSYLGLHRTARAILDTVANEGQSAEAILSIFCQELFALRDDRARCISSLIASRSEAPDLLPSTEAILSLMGQCLAFRNHRLTVFIIAAAHQAVATELSQAVRVRPADEQTGAIGDVEITLVSDEQIRTVYEMKHKAVTREDIDRAIQKVAGTTHQPDNYIFVTTEAIDRAVRDYAASLYASTGGIEFAVLDCVGFLRHFLHLFHRHRTAFLDAYEALVLAEPDSAVNFDLKQAFLVLRTAAIPPVAGQ